MPAPGLLVPGTIDPSHRPRVFNPDGTYSTLRTITIEDQGRVVLLPTIVNGRAVTSQEAVQHYHRTGEHLGIFDSEANAEAYDRALHEQIEPGSDDRGGQSMADAGGGGMAAQGLYGLSPEEMQQLQDRVAPYRQSRFGGGPLSQLPPGHQPSALEVLGPDLYHRILNAGVGGPGGAMQSAQGGVAPSELPLATGSAPVNPPGGPDDSRPPGGQFPPAPLVEPGARNPGYSQAIAALLARQRPFGGGAG